MANENEKELCKLLKIQNADLKQQVVFLNETLNELRAQVRNQIDKGLLFVTETEREFEARDQVLNKHIAALSTTSSVD